MSLIISFSHHQGVCILCVCACACVCKIPIMFTALRQLRLKQFLRYYPNPSATLPKMTRGTVRPTRLGAHNLAVVSVRGPHSHPAPFLYSCSYHQHCGLESQVSFSAMLENLHEIEERWKISFITVSCVLHVNFDALYNNWLSSTPKWIEQWVWDVTMAPGDGQVCVAV